MKLGKTRSGRPLTLTGGPNLPGIVVLIGCLYFASVGEWLPLAILGGSVALLLLAAYLEWLPPD